MKLKWLLVAGLFGLVLVAIKGQLDYNEQVAKAAKQPGTPGATQQNYNSGD